MTKPLLPEAQLGPAEKLLDLVLNSSAHLWHNRPGLDVGGKWVAAKNKHQKGGVPVKPGLFVPAAEALYSRLIEIYSLNVDLMAHFASYALKETDWRDLKVAAAALMLVQQRSGQPVFDEGAGKKKGKRAVGFYDDDYRAIGEAMILHYAKKSPRMLTPKGVLRVAELLESKAIADLNRMAGFADPASKGAPMGRWKRAATRWLKLREKNPAMLEGLVKAGYKETIKKLARKAGYKPESQRFFEVLGWKQKQAKGGHREVGLGALRLEKSERFDGLSEAEICEWIEGKKLSYKEAIGRLPKGMGLTPAIMAALLPSLSDKDLRILTPTLEELGLMADAEVRTRWERAIASSEDQRGLNIAKNVRSKELRDKLEDASDVAARKAVKAATRDAEVHVFFLIDKSGSMQGAIEQSKDALSKILAGFPAERVHIATFDTMGTVLRPKAPTRAGITHMLSGIKAEGGTMHAAAVNAIHASGVRIPAGAKLIVFVVGDEAGEAGEQLARAFGACGYKPSAMAVLLNVAVTRGHSVQGCAATLGLPYSVVGIDQFDDPYQVPRVLGALMEAPIAEAGVSRTTAWVEKVMKTELLTVK